VSLPTDDGVDPDSALPEDEWATADPDSSAVPPTAEQTRTDEKSYDTTLTQPVAALGADSLLAGLPAGLRDHPRYRVIRELGHGGMGSVYIAEHKLMGRTVALKTVQLRVADNPALVERFLREVRTKSLMLEESGRQAVLPLVAIRPDLPVRAAALVERMTARRQQDRFQSCAEVVDALAPMCGR
jgi:hypothetical protein